MSPESQVEEAIYLAALSLPDPPVRNQFLNRACAGDDRLRAAVESMLEAMSGAEYFFARGRAAVHRPEMEVPLVAASRAVNRLAAASGVTSYCKNWGRAVAERFFSRNKPNPSGARWRSRSSSWGWTPGTLLRDLRPSDRPSP